MGLSAYETQPREYVLSSVTTTAVHARISDLFRSPMDQVGTSIGLLLIFGFRQLPLT